MLSLSQSQSLGVSSVKGVPLVVGAAVPSAARGKRNCFNLQSLGFSSHATVVKLPLYYLCNVD